MEIIQTRAAQEATPFRATVATAGCPAPSVAYSSPQSVMNAVEALLTQPGTFSVRVGNPGTPRVPPEWSITGLGEVDLIYLLDVLRAARNGWPALADKICAVLGLPATGMEGSE